MAIVDVGQCFSLRFFILVAYLAIGVGCKPPHPFWLYPGAPQAQTCKCVMVGCPDKPRVWHKRVLVLFLTPINSAHKDSVDLVKAQQTSDMIGEHPTIIIIRHAAKVSSYCHTCQYAVDEGRCGKTASTGH